MDPLKLQEEALREAACIGDIESVVELLTKGINPNSQNAINGWGALHWAVKRGHQNIVNVLLECGADPTLTNHKGETASQLTTDLTLIESLGENVDSLKIQENVNGSAQTFIPSYLAHPPLIQTIDQTYKSKPDKISAAMNQVSAVASGSGSTSQSEERNTEIVIKVRVANLPDPDFIEVEVPEPTLSCLLRVCCEELGVAAQRVTRVRKLPNTVVRKDKDVQRLLYLQEIELVVEGPIGGGPLGTNNKSNLYKSISKFKNQTILY